MIRAILWDVDGTLLDFGAAESAAVKRLFLEFGLGPCTDEAVRRYSAINERYWQRLERGEISKPQVLEGRFREFFSLEGIDPELAPAFNARYQLALGDTIVCRDDCISVISSLRGRVKQAVVSNGTVLAQRKKLALSGIGALMDAVFLSEALGAEKPSSVFFDRVMEAIGPLDRGQVMIVGDSLTSDMLGGDRAGLVTCWYNPSHKPRTTACRIDYEITDLHQVPELLSAGAP